jgi:hypothetical protein
MCETSQSALTPDQKKSHDIRGLYLMAKTYIKNFGVVSNLVVRSSRGTPVSHFTLTGAGGKFSRDVAVFGEEKVQMMKTIGNGGRAWVRGELVEMSREGGAYKEMVLKGYNLKDLDAADAAKAAEKAAAAEAGEDTSADADTTAEAAVEAEAVAADADVDIDDQIPFGGHTMARYALITYREENPRTGRIEELVSHGINLATDRMLITSNDRPEDMGAFFDNEVGEWILDESRPAARVMAH